MPNIDRPHGFQSIGRTLSGGEPLVDEFDKAAGVGTAIFVNDLAFAVNDGTITPAGTPGTTPIVGVALNYGAASTATKHTLIISPDVLLEAQSDNDATGLVASSRNLNANAILGAGDATTLISGHEIDTSTAATTATLDLRLRKLLAEVGNEYGEFARFVCTINRHIDADQIAGI
jgi:hypothetical protein